MIEMGLTLTTGAAASGGGAGLPLPPNAPTGVEVTLSEGGTVTLAWTDTNSGTAAYEIYYGANGAAADTLLATTAAGASGYGDTIASPSANQRCYKVRALRTGQRSDFSSIVYSAPATPMVDGAAWSSGDSDIQVAFSHPCGQTGDIGGWVTQFTLESNANGAGWASGAAYFAPADRWLSYTTFQSLADLSGVFDPDTSVVMRVRAEIGALSSGWAVFDPVITA